MGLITTPLTEAVARGNRTNAQASTGSQTAEGKRRSSGSALKHGIYGRYLHQAILDLGEDPELEIERIQALSELLDEKQLVTFAYEWYLKEHVTVTPALLKCLASRPRRKGEDVAGDSMARAEFRPGDRVQDPLSPRRVCLRLLFTGLTQ